MKLKRRYFAPLLAIVGTFLLLLGLSMTVPVPTHAGESAQLAGGYAGAEECTDCHRDVGRSFMTSDHATTLFDVAAMPEAVVADFSIGEDVRVFQFPGEAEARPITLADVAYGVGAGHKVQRFLIRTENGDLQVLPVEWRADTGEWQAFTPPGAGDWNTTCAACHTTGYDADSHEWIDDAVTCESCHGAGFEHVQAADDAGGDIDDDEMARLTSTITTEPDPMVCKTCHTGTPDIAICGDGVHCVDDPYDNWLMSSHSQVHTVDGESAYALDCAGCHAPHDDGLTSDLVAEGTCLSCHQNGADSLIRGDPIVEQVVGRPSAHYEEGLACSDCHDPHTIQSVPDTPTQATTCTNCHSDLSEPGIRDFVSSAAENISGRLQNIEALLTDDTPEWVHTVLTTIHHDGSHGVHNYAYVSRLLDAVETEMGIQQPVPLANVPVVAPADPVECAECHAEVHDMWQTSPHANASLSETFQQAYAENGQQTYCMTCHASGYDPNTQEYVFEGVVCSTCHTMQTGEHPPGPMSVADSSEMCGQCHSGEHSPEYNEWLISDHSGFNIDCVDCHVAHDNSLRLDDVNATCADCHQDAMNDEIHMGEDMTCVDCHMTRMHGDELVIQHTMFFDPKTCAECHGDIHTLQDDTTRNLSDEDRQAVVLLEEQMQTLEEKADTNLESGIVGGAFGSLVLIGFLFLAVRLGRIR